MLSHWHLVPTTAYLLVFGVWLLSLYTHDASLIDRFWGLGFIAISLVTAFAIPSVGLHGWVVLALVSLWGLRLSLYIHFRNRGKPEDSRYAAMRKTREKYFWIWSLFAIFGLQGTLMGIISLPLVAGLTEASFSLLDAVGVAVWSVGFVFEAGSDYQMSRFKANPQNKGQVCNSGFWGLSRHPNYFGETLVWWGFFLIALNGTNWYVVLVSPILVTFLLLKVSGVTLLEDNLKSSKPKYKEYIEKVPAFFPKIF